MPMNKSKSIPAEFEFIVHPEEVGGLQGDKLAMGIWINKAYNMLESDT